jgi:hypothetical protein
MQLGKPVDDPLLKQRISKTKLQRKELAVAELIDHLNAVFKKILTVKNFVSELIHLKEKSSAKIIELITMVEDFDRNTLKRITSTTTLIEAKCLERKLFLTKQMEAVTIANASTNNSYVISTTPTTTAPSTINNSENVDETRGFDEIIIMDDYLDGNCNFQEVRPNSPRNLLSMSREVPIKKLDPVVVNFNIVPSKGTFVCPLNDIPSCVIGDIIHNDFFIDGLGGYMVFFTLLTKILDLLIQNLMKITSAKSELSNFSVYSAILEQMTKIMKHASYLAQIYELIYRSINEAVGEAEINEMMNLIEIPPFWYEYGAGLPHLKYVIELVKSSTFHSTKNNDVNDSLDILSVGYHSVKQLSRKVIGTVNDAEFVALHRSSSVQTLKAFFNLPDHPLCRNFTSLVLPNILTSKKIWIPRSFLTNGTNVPVCCLLLSNFKIPFTIPPEYFTAPSQDAGLAKSSSSKSNANLSDSTKLLLGEINIELDVILHFHGGTV